MWKTVKLGDVCTIYNGGTPKSDIKEYWEGDVQWLTPKDMGKLNNKYVKDTERKITQQGLDNSSAKLVPSNSIILSCRAPIGHVSINDVDMSFNQGCKSLVPCEDILVEYLYYFLFSSKKLLNDLGTGTTFKEISSKTLANVSLLLPPLTEQQRIVAKLDATFTQIDKAMAGCELQLLKLRNLNQKIFDEELNAGSSRVEFENIVSEKGTGLERRANFQSANRAFPYLKMNNISSENKLSIHDYTSVDASAEEVKKYTLNEGDFLFNTRNSVDLVGKTAVASGLNGWLFNNNILRVKFVKRVNANYVNYFFCSSEGKQQLNLRKTGTTNVAAVYYKNLKTIKIPMLPEDEQDRIVSKLKAIEKHNSFYLAALSNKISDLTSLKSAILTQELQPSEAA